VQKYNSTPIVSRYREVRVRRKEEKRERKKERKKERMNE
jgi:hypothetical protein